MRRLSRKTTLSIVAVCLGVAAIVYAQVTTTTSLGRLELLFPDYKHVDNPPGSLHSKMTDYMQKISDNMNGRYFTDSQIENVTTTYRPNYGVDFSTQCTYLYTGTFPNLTIVSDPTGAGWTIVANGTNPTQEIDVTTPSTPGTYNYAIITTATACGRESIDDFPEIDISSTPPSNGDFLVWDGAKFIPGGASELSATRSGIAKGAISQYQVLRGIDDSGSKLQSIVDIGTYALFASGSGWDAGNVANSTTFGDGQRYFWNDTHEAFYTTSTTAGSIAMSGVTGLESINNPTITPITHTTFTNTRMRLDDIDADSACACMTDNNQLFFAKLDFTDKEVVTIGAESTSSVATTGTVVEFACGYDPVGNLCVAGVVNTLGNFISAGWNPTTDALTPLVTATTTGSFLKVEDFIKVPSENKVIFKASRSTNEQYLIAMETLAGPTLGFVDEHLAGTYVCDPMNGQITVNPNGNDFLMACKDGTSLSYVAGNLTGTTISTGTKTDYQLTHDYVIRPTYDTLANTFLLYSVDFNVLYYHSFEHDGGTGGTLGSSTLLHTFSSGGSDFSLGSFITSNPFASQVVLWGGGFSGDSAFGYSPSSIDPDNAIGFSLEAATDGQTFDYALFGDVTAEGTLGATIGPLYSSGSTGIVGTSPTGLKVGNVFEIGKIQTSSKFAPSGADTYTYKYDGTITSTTNPVFESIPFNKGFYLVTCGFEESRIVGSASLERAFTRCQATVAGSIRYLTAASTTVLSCGNEINGGTGVGTFERKGGSCVALAEVKTDGAIFRMQTLMSGTGQIIDPYMIIQPINSVSFTEF